MIRTALRPWTQRSTWWTLVHLLLGLVVGYVVTTAVFVTGILTVATLVLLPIAIALSWLGLVVAHGMAALERSRYRAMLGADFSDPQAIDWNAPAQATQEGSAVINSWTRYKIRLRSPSRWREVLYLLLRLPVSAIEWWLLSLLWVGSVILISLPVLAGRLPNGVANFGLFSIGPGWEAWALALIGAATLILAAPWATVWAGAVDVAFGRALLARGSRSAMEEQVVRLESSRAAAIDGAEAERRRIERDLHDGAQQRLIAAAMDLGVARERLESDPPAGRELVEQAHGEVKAAMKELRDLVRGIHPVILEDRGLDAALSAVVARAGLPVELKVNVEPRPGPAVESAAYFIACEALTNVTRHSGARSAGVDIVRRAEILHMTITDDGNGGADPAAGTGLIGLSERVEALGGSFRLHSPVGGPTTIEVELPCGS